MNVTLCGHRSPAAYAVGRRNLGPGDVRRDGVGHRGRRLARVPDFDSVHTPSPAPAGTRSARRYGRQASTAVSGQTVRTTSRATGGFVAAKEATSTIPV